jgi:hypothetical protein
MDKYYNKAAVLIDLLNDKDNNKKLYEQDRNGWKKRVNQNFLNENILYLENPQVCNQSNRLKYKSKYPFVNFNELSKLFRDNFYNNELIQIISCIVSLVTSGSYVFPSLLIPEKFIDAKIKSQLIIFSKLLDSENSIISFKYDDNWSTLHEGIVGLFVGNQIRKIIPTFIWTFGFTECNLPIYGKNKKIITTCNKKVKFEKDTENIENKEYIGIITEKIDGISLEEWILSNNYNEEDLYRTILIIFNSLVIAYENFKFVHYDLHTDNIMMRKLKEPSYVKIDENIYIKTPGSFLPTIFDFGLSCFEYKNQKYGNFEFPELGIDPMNANLGVDFVKLMSFIRIYLEKKSIFNSNIFINSDIFTNIFKILKIFLSNPDGTTKFILTDSYYVLPNLKYYKEFNFREICNYIAKDLLKNFTIYESNVPKEKVLSCDDNPCDNMEVLIEKLYNRTTIESSYDLETLENLMKEKLDKNIINDFIQIFDKNIDSIVMDIKNLMNSEKYKNIIYIETINYLTIKAVEIKSIIDEISKVMNILLKFKNLPLNINDLSNIKDNFDFLVKSFKEIKNLIMRDLLQRKKFIEEGEPVLDYDLLQPTSISEEIDSIIFDIINS